MSRRRDNAGALLRVGIVGAVVTALCCFTPILVVLFGVLGLSALTGYLDLALLPLLAASIGLIVYALKRKRDEAACCVETESGENERQRRGISE